MANLEGEKLHQQLKWIFLNVSQFLPWVNQVEPKQQHTCHPSIVCQIVDCSGPRKYHLQMCQALLQGKCVEFRMNKHWLLYGEIFLIITWLLIASSAFMLLSATLLLIIFEHHVTFEKAILSLLNFRMIAGKWWYVRHASHCPQFEHL